MTSLDVEGKLVAESETLARLEPLLSTYESFNDEYLQIGLSDKKHEQYKKILTNIDILEKHAHKKSKQLTRELAFFQRKKELLDRYQSFIKRIIVTKSMSAKRDHFLAGKQRKDSLRKIKSTNQNQ